MDHRIIMGDCMEHMEKCDCIFMDPPDNLGKYGDDIDDNLPTWYYLSLLRIWIYSCMECAPVVWLSFNAKYTLEVADIVQDGLRLFPQFEFTPCQQVITFYQHCHTKLGNAHRPLYLLMHKEMPLFTDAIRIESDRQKTGDKRADPRGKVPGDVFPFPRVVGNSKQRRKWHDTQLNEGLVERCLLLTTLPNDHVIDPFAGTGTTLRVCKRIDRRCTLIEKSLTYYQHLIEEHPDVRF